MRRFALHAFALALAACSGSRAGLDLLSQPDDPPAPTSYQAGGDASPPSPCPGREDAAGGDSASDAGQDAADASDDALDATSSDEDVLDAGLDASEDAQPADASVEAADDASLDSSTEAGDAEPE